MPRGDEIASNLSLGLQQDTSRLTQTQAACARNLHYSYLDFRIGNIVEFAGVLHLLAGLFWIDDNIDYKKIPYFS